MASIILISSCTLGRDNFHVSGGDVRTQRAHHYSFRSVGEKNSDASDVIQSASGRLLVFPFTVSLQRHFLVKDPVYQRADYQQISESITTSVQQWSRHHEYELDVLDAEQSRIRFASQRITSTAIRLLNKKQSIDEIPPLQDLVRNPEFEKIIFVGEKADTQAIANSPMLILAGSYTGHSKSDGQLIKERISSRMRYLGSFGRRQLVRPTTGFGKLFAVLLDAQTGEVVWYGDAESSPGAVHHTMDALLSEIQTFSGIDPR